jgi:hypothetical protein
MKALGALVYRAMGAAVLDASVYEGIEADPRATRQALTVVLLASVAAGIGAGGWSGPKWPLLVSFGVLALITWVAWAVMILHVGGRYFREPQTQVDLGELLRTIGFAAAPGVFQAAGIVPFLTVPVFVISWLWMLAAMIVAVQHALDFPSPARAMIVCAVSLALAVTLAVLLSLSLSRTVALG